MQGKNSLQTNNENLKNFGTDGNNLIHMERISNIDYKFEKDNTYDKTNFEAFDNCKSQQTDLPCFISFMENIDKNKKYLKK